VRELPDDSRRLRLADGCRLDAPPNQGGVLLTLGGDAVQLNEMAFALLSRCDGTRAAGEIARIAASGTPAPDRTREDVLEFLAMAEEIGWIRAA
jgi:hypothetical protein